MLTESTNYERLGSLRDIQAMPDLTSEAIRDILRRQSGDASLEVVEMGEIEDMSGTNDAFNSTICSLRVKVKKHDGGQDTIHFVIKNPPKMNFIRQVIVGLCPK